MPALRLLFWILKGNIIYYEIADRFDVGSLRKLRQKEEGAALMILTSPSVSPMEYLKPGIAPDLLLLRPFGQKEFDQVNTVKIILLMVCSQIDLLVAGLKKHDPAVGNQSSALPGIEDKMIIRIRAVHAFQKCIEKLRVTRN